MSSPPGNQKTTISKKKFDLDNLLFEKEQKEQLAQKSGFYPQLSALPNPSKTIVSNQELSCSSEQIDELNRPILEVLKGLIHVERGVARRENIKNLVNGIVGNHRVSGKQQELEVARKALESVGFDEHTISEVLETPSVSPVVTFLRGQRLRKLSAPRNAAPKNAPKRGRKPRAQQPDPFKIPAKRGRRRGKRSTETQIVEGKEIVPEFPIQKLLNFDFGKTLNAPSTVQGTAKSRLLPISECSEEQLPYPLPNLSLIHSYLIHSLNFGESNRSTIDCSSLFTGEWVNWLCYEKDYRNQNEKSEKNEKFQTILENALSWTNWEVKFEQHVLNLLNHFPKLREHVEFKSFIESHEATNTKMLACSKKGQNMEKEVMIKSLNYLEMLFESREFKLEQLLSFVLWNVHYQCSKLPISGFSCLKEVLTEHYHLKRVSSDH